MWQHLENIYKENNIKAKYDVRDDMAYYNESEPDIEKLKAAKRFQAKHCVLKMMYFIYL